MTGWNKSVRALFAALMTTLLALLMHVGAGGEVSVVGSIIVFVLVLWVAMILAGRRLGYVSLTALLALGQGLMHLSMDWFAGPISAGTSSAASGGSAAMAAMDHQHMGHGTGSVDLGATTSMSHPMSHMMGDAAGVTMLVSHTIAVVITAVILKRGEDIILSILQLALGPVSTVLRALAEALGVFAEFPARIVQGEYHLPQAITVAVLGPNYRRGPPSFV